MMMMVACGVQYVKYRSPYRSNGWLSYPASSRDAVGHRGGFVMVFLPCGSALHVNK